MPISAAGRADGDALGARGFTSRRRPAEHGFTPSWRSAEHGFTLVELLVVLTIIALLSATVLLSVPDPRGTLASEAERFAARAKAAQDRAIMDNRPIALRISPGGYAFSTRESGTWREMNDKPFAPQRWGEGVRVSVTADNGRTVFDTTGFADPLHVALARGREQVAVDIANGGAIRVVH